MAGHDNRERRAFDVIPLIDVREREEEEDENGAMVMIREGCQEMFEGGPRQLSALTSARSFHANPGTLCFDVKSLQNLALISNLRASHSHLLKLE